MVKLSALLSTEERLIFVVLAALRVSHIARYAPSLRLAKTPNIKRHSANITVQMVLDPESVDYCPNESISLSTRW